MTQHKINPDAVITQLFIGEESNPIVIIDDFLLKPNELIEHAKDSGEFFSTPNDFYPGHRKNIESNYGALVSEMIEDTYAHYFNLGKDREPNVGLCSFSVTTTPERQLRPIQSLPHFDNSNPFQMATVHYLFPSSHGGTSFYRHRKTGFESINVQRMKPYANQIKAEVMAAKFIGKNYMDGDNDWFERVASVEAKFNRMVLFQGFLLHSGDINPRAGLQLDLDSGRLTANTFISFEKK